MTIDELKPIIEALIYVSEEPITVKQLAALLEGESAENIQAAVEQLSAEFNSRGGGLEVRQLRFERALLRCRAVGLRLERLVLLRQRLALLLDLVIPPGRDARCRGCAREDDRPGQENYMRMDACCAAVP